MKIAKLKDKNGNEILPKSVVDFNSITTEEKVIGTYLGDILYKKAIKVTTALNTGENLIPHGISNLKLCTSIKAVSAANQVLPRFEGTTSITGATSIKAVNGTNIVVGVIGDGWSSRDWYFIIEYTKE